MLTRYWWAVVRRLDRPGRRGLLTLPGSVWVSLTYRAPCLVYWRDGAWIHHYRGAKIPHASFGRAAPPRVFTAQAREMFLYEYIPQAGDVVFDIGAGVGAEMLLFSRLVGPVRAGRFRGGTSTHIRAPGRSLQGKRPSKRDTAPGRGLRQDGTVAISDLDHHLRNAVLEDQLTESRYLPVESTRLRASSGVERIDLLKMNIEGAERQAIQGMEDSPRNTRHVCISCHDFLADDGGPGGTSHQGLRA